MHMQVVCNICLSLDQEMVHRREADCAQLSNEHCDDRKNRAKFTLRWSIMGLANKSMSGLSGV